MPRRGKQSRGYEDADESDRYARGSRKVQDSYRAKKVIVYVNGHEMIPGKKMSVSTSNYPTFEGFLDQLSSELGLMWSVQNLYKVGGKKVKSIEDMEDGDIYVAGTGKYIRGDYGSKDTTVTGWSTTGKLPTTRSAWDQIQKGKDKSGSLDDGYESEPVSEKPKREKKKNSQRSQSVDQHSPRKGRRGRRNRSPSESEDESDHDQRSRRGGRKGLPPKDPSRRQKSKYR